MLAVSQAALGGRSTALGGGISALEMDQHSYCAGFFPRVKCERKQKSICHAGVQNHHFFPHYFCLNVRN